MARGWVRAAVAKIVIGVESGIAIMVEEVLTKVVSTHKKSRHSLHTYLFMSMAESLLQLRQLMLNTIEPSVKHALMTWSNNMIHLSSPSCRTLAPNAHHCDLRVILLNLLASHPAYAIFLAWDLTSAMRQTCPRFLGFIYLIRTLNDTRGQTHPNVF